MIRTTHVGSLPRPDDVLDALGEREAEGPEPDPELVRRAVAECVERQVEMGLDVVNDGEMGKASYVTYVRDRLTGFTPGRPPPGPRNNALDDFPEFVVRTWHRPAGRRCAAARWPTAARARSRPTSRPCAPRSPTTRGARAS